MKKMSKEKNSTNTKLVAVVLICIGIFILISGIYLEYKHCNAITNIILMACTAAGGSFLTAAISILSFRFTGVVEFVKTQAENILMKNSYIKNLSVAKLEKMRTEINSVLFNDDVAGDDESLLNHVTKSIEPLVGGHYFEKFYMEVEIEHNPDTPNIITKRIVKELSVKPICKDEEGTIRLREMLRGAVEEKTINGELVISEEKLEIDEENKNVKIKYSERKGDSDGYHQEFELVFEDDNVEDVIQFGEQGCEIRIEFVIKNKIEDNIIINKVDVPCKEYTARIIYDYEKFKLNYSSYAFMHKEGMTAKPGVDKSLRFEAKNWCLPGDGFVVQYNKIN